MVKGVVKTNKANDTKYIYLSKDCGFNDGQEVDIKFSGYGIYRTDQLKEYFENNKNMFLEIKNKLEEIRKDIWKREFFDYADVIGKYFDFGKLEWDEEFYFEKINDYCASPFGDIDGGKLGSRIDKEYIEEAVISKELNKEDVKKELIHYLIIRFLQDQSEECIEDVNRMEVDMLKSYGFENKKVTGYLHYNTTLYSNGIVQIWYDAEEYAYNKTLNISTMKEIDWEDKESNIEF